MKEWRLYQTDGKELFVGYWFARDEAEAVEHGQAMAQVNFGPQGELFAIQEVA